MYTAKIIQKIQEPTTRQWIVDVEFTDGTDTFIEAIKPQDKVGFQHWLDSRLQSLNGLAEFVAEDNLNQIIEVKTAVVVPPTQDELDKQLWLERDALKEQVDKAIAKGYLTGSETKVVQLNKWLKDNFKPEYIGIL